MNNESPVCRCGRPAKHPGAGRLYHHTSETDALIRGAYAKLRNFGNRRALPALCVKLGWPKHAVNRRGQELGLAKTKEKPWSNEEKVLLEKGSPVACTYPAEVPPGRIGPDRDRH